MNPTMAIFLSTHSTNAAMWALLTFQHVGLLAHSLASSCFWCLLYQLLYWLVLILGSCLSECGLAAPAHWLPCLKSNLCTIVVAALPFLQLKNISTNILKELQWFSNCLTTWKKWIMLTIWEPMTKTLLQGTYFNQDKVEHHQQHQSKQILLICWTILPLSNCGSTNNKWPIFGHWSIAAIYDGKKSKELLPAAKATLLDPTSAMEEGMAALMTAKSEKELKHLRIQFKEQQQQ